MYSYSVGKPRLPDASSVLKFYTGENERRKIDENPERKSLSRRWRYFLYASIVLNENKSKERENHFFKF